MNQVPTTQIISLNGLGYQVSRSFFHAQAMSPGYETMVRDWKTLGFDFWATLA